MEHKPSYYAVLPASVRYCLELKPSAKLMYAELTALAQAKGYAFASNTYLAGLFGVTPRAIQTWLEQLRELGFIDCQMHPRADDSTKSERRIYIAESVGGGEQIFTGGVNKSSRGGVNKSSPITIQDNNNTVVLTEVSTSAPHFIFQLWCQKVSAETGANPQNPAAEAKAVKDILKALESLELPDVDKPVNAVFGKALTEPQKEILKNNAELLAIVKTFSTFVHLSNESAFLRTKYRLALYLQCLNETLGRNHAKRKSRASQHREAGTTTADFLQRYRDNLSRIGGGSLPS